MPDSAILDSILQSIKKLNNVAPEYTAFDEDFILYINAALADLQQLGVGPAEGFAIQDKNDFWIDLFPDENPIYNRVKNYVGLHVRLRFDPPPTSFGIDQMQKQLDEMAWRIVAAQEDKEAEEAV